MSVRAAKDFMSSIYGQFKAGDSLDHLPDSIIHAFKRQGLTVEVAAAPLADGPSASSSRPARRSRRTTVTESVTGSDPAEAASPSTEAPSFARGLSHTALTPDSGETTATESDASSDGLAVLSRPESSD
jgi:hypothetical protein